ncbi:MAG: nucleoside-diphosphate kinase [Dehalococcoidia bacterium]
MERTLILIKPDAMQRGLAGAILSRLEERGLKIVGLKLLRIDDALARRHYAEHEGKPFLESLVSFITSAPVVAAVFEGPNAVETVRTVMGATDPQKAAPGTIRGDYGLYIQYNLIHGSDSPESAKREIALFFDEAGLVSWQRDVEPWLHEG